MTQAAFAESVGVGGQYQWQVESGRQVYGRETVLAIADKYGADMERLGITVEDLLRGTPPCVASDDPTEGRKSA